MFQSPVSEPQIRVDPHGDGHFLAPRSDWKKEDQRFHRGLDLVVVPNEIIMSPIAGKVVRMAFPYAGDTKWKGLFIKGRYHWVKIFYIQPMDYLVETQVFAGEVIGVAQDIRDKYDGGMLPHIHLAVMIPPMESLSHDGILVGNEIYINPEPLVFTSYGE